MPCVWQDVYHRYHLGCGLLSHGASCGECGVKFVTRCPKIRKFRGFSEQQEFLKNFHKNLRNPP